MCVIESKKQNTLRIQPMDPAITLPSATDNHLLQLRPGNQPCQPVVIVNKCNPERQSSSYQVTAYQPSITTLERISQRQE